MYYGSDQPVAEWIKHGEYEKRSQGTKPVYMILPEPLRGDAKGLQM